MKPQETAVPKSEQWPSDMPYGKPSGTSIASMPTSMGMSITTNGVQWGDDGSVIDPTRNRDCDMDD